MILVLVLVFPIGLCVEDCDYALPAIFHGGCCGFSRMRVVGVEEEDLLLACALRSNDEAEIGGVFPDSVECSTAATRI